MTIWRRSDLHDAAIAAGCGVASVLSVEIVADRLSGEARVWAVVTMIGLCAPLVARRRCPEASAVAVAAVTCVVWWCFDTDGPTAVVGPLAMFALGRHGRPRWSTGAFTAALLALGSTAAVLAVRDGTAEGWFALAARMGFAAAPYWLGESLRAKTELAESYRARAERAELDRAAEACRATADERARIARELHDVVAHSVSVIVVQSDVADRLADIDPAHARQAIRRVGDLARSTMSEMRRVVGVLGPDEPANTPQPTLADLDALVGRCADAGLSVHVTGVDRLPALADGAELSLYRIVQESCTNALKHAGARNLHARFTVEERLELEVVDDGRDQAELDVPGSGRGLVGMRERVHALHGTLQVGRVSGGGFRVATSFPLEAVLRAEASRTGL